ncbi:MAG: Ig-like domain-containing protein, partial [Nanoarchaeota archaeon]
NATIRNVSDTGQSLLDTVIFQFSNSTGTSFNRTPTNVSGTFNVALDLSSLTEGTSVMTVFANDSENNRNNSQTVSFVVDRTPPNVTRNFLNNAVNDSNFSIRSGNQTFNASVFDATTRVDTVYFRFDNGTSQDFNVTGRNNSGQWVVSYNVSTLAEGRQGIRIVANDTINNVNNINDTFVINFTVDFTPPNITRNFINNAVNDSNFSIRSSNQTFNASIFDALTQVERVYFWFDNGTSQDFNVTAVNQSGNWIVSYNVSTLAEGRQGIRIVANDTVSNVNDTTVINFTIDYSAPTVNISSPLNTSTLSGTQSFNARVNDGFTAVNTVIFQFTNSSNPFNRTASNSSGTWSVSVNTAGIDEGVITITVFANDTVGNSNTTQVISITIDNIAEVPGGGGAPAESTPSTTTTPSAPSPPASAPTEAPSTPSISETASATEASASFENGQSSVSISSAGGKAITTYTSENNYKVTITNNLNKKLVLSGALKTKEAKLEFEENAKKRLQE